MPIAKNLFQILNLHPQKHILKKKTWSKLLVLKEKFTEMDTEFWFYVHVIR